MTKDKDIWDAYKRVVTPTPKKTRKAHTVKQAPEKTALRKAAETGPLPLPKTQGQPLSPNALRALERNREKSLRQGDIDIDAKLDLHGMTQAQAFAALTAFMHKKAKAGKRHLLIITGKGRGGEGVLRANLQNWLTQLPEANRIMALRPAAIKHGGDGAFYVILRKLSS